VVSTSLSLHRADEATIGYVTAVLERNGLPTADVAATGRFYLAVRDGDRVGVGGIEPIGTAGLLRSVVVTAPYRGQGLGRELCVALEARAAAAGIETLYLLTTTAAEFFAAQGYVETERSAVPESVRNTAEFDALCPSTATCLSKSLATSP
jgi:amino-acid N-acetyltransferase